VNDVSARARLDAATKHLEPPLAVVDLDAFDQNAADLARRAAGLPIRLASKSIRCRFLLERALAMPGFAGVMACSLPEALWLARELDGTDILVAYPTVDHIALRELARDERARRSISIMIDSVEHLDLIDAGLGSDHPEIRVCIELDVSWRPLRGLGVLHVGPRRSPVFTPRQAADLAVTIAEAVDAKVAAMPNDLVARNAAAGSPLNLLRAEHRAEHLREIEHVFR